MITNQDLQNKKSQYHKKVSEWTDKKISISYPGYNPDEVDIILNEILNCLTTIIDDYFELKSNYLKLELENMNLFNDNKQKEQKLNILTKEIELEKLKKR